MPTLDRVLESYQEFEKLSDAPLTIISEVLWILVGIIFIVHLIQNRKSISALSFFYRSCSLMLILVIIGYLSFTINSYDFSMDEDHWKEEFLTPYLESLPEHKQQVTDFAQLIDYDKSGIESVYINEEHPIWVKVTLMTDHGDEQELIVKTTIVKESVEQPYLTYKTIEKPISEKYSDEAYYNTTLHIPKEFRILSE